MRSALPFAASAAFGLLVALPAGPAARAETAAVPAARTETAMPPLLRSSVQVAAPEIRLGDLFDHAGIHADDVVAAAPAPGVSLLFETPWLVATARNHGLDWQPPSAETAIRVQRAARSVDNAELAQALAGPLGVAGTKTQIQFDTQYRFAIPVGEQPGYSIDHVELNQKVARFTAELHVQDGDQAAPAGRLSGRLIAMTDVPVLTRPMQPGDKLGAADIGWTEVASATLSAGDIMVPADMIGRTPRHPLQAGQPLRPIDLQMPVLIKRNDPVLIVLERPGLYLTAEGKAMEDGGKDAVIRVVNIQSNRTIDAIVLASGQVAVRSPELQQTASR
jgi:flagella basal body P-ring formation protein FlgA